MNYELEYNYCNRLMKSKCEICTPNEVKYIRFNNSKLLEMGTIILRVATFHHELSEMTIGQRSGNVDCSIDTKKIL